MKCDTHIYIYIIFAKECGNGQRKNTSEDIFDYIAKHKWLLTQTMTNIAFELENFKILKREKQSKQIMYFKGL